MSKYQNTEAMKVIKGNYLNNENGLFKITFHGNHLHHIFTSAPEVLGNLIQEHGEYGIISIKRFVESKDRFDRLTKTDVAMLFSWDTHSMEQLKRVGYIIKNKL